MAKLNDISRNECIMRLALRSIEVNLTGKDYRHERIADSLRRATEALQQIQKTDNHYLCACGYGCHQTELEVF